MEGSDTLCFILDWVILITELFRNGAERYDHQAPSLQ